MENELECLGDRKGHDGHFAKQVLKKILFLARVIVITLSRFGNKCVYLKTEFLYLTNLSSTRVLKLNP